MKKCDRRPQSAGAEAEPVRRYVGARSCGLLGVVIAYVAMSRGVALPYVVMILCTLGIYSVYSFLVVGKTISWKIAAAAGGAVATLGALAGFCSLGLR